MSTKSINITIAGRTYPINVKPEQEETLLKISNDIDSHMKYLKESYAIKDNQDVLAMTLLEFGNRLEDKKVDEAGRMSSGMLQEIDSLLDELR